MCILLPSRHNYPYDSKVLKSYKKHKMSTQWDPISFNNGYIPCWPEDSPVLAETCRLNVNIIDFKTLLS
jgi:hypothetical protein